MAKEKQIFRCVINALTLMIFVQRTISIKFELFGLFVAQELVHQVQVWPAANIINCMAISNAY